MNIIDLIKEYRIPTAPEGHHHSRINWIQVDCPYCGRNSEKWHLGISIEYIYVSCWRCGHHPLIPTLSEILGMSEVKVKKLIKGIVKQRIEIDRPTGKLQIPKGVRSLHPAHKHYLHERGFKHIQDLEILWGLQGFGLNAKLSWRIFIPIFLRGEVVSWTTRSLSKESKSKYISAGPEEERLPHKELLYGEDFARHTIVIVEGPTDAWKIGPGAVATLGTAVTNRQIERMIKYPRRVICFDSEIKAQSQARKLLDVLSLYGGDTSNIELDSPDPGSASHKEISYLRKFLA